MKITKKQLRNSIQLVLRESKEKLQLIDDIEGLFNQLYGGFSGTKVPDFESWDEFALKDYYETLMHFAVVQGLVGVEYVGDEDTVFPDEVGEEY